MTHEHSLRATEGSEPFGFYEELRDHGDVVWDDELNTWLLTSYDVVKRMMRNDEVLFRHPDVGSADFMEIAGGRRHIKFLTGAEHHRMHHWLLRFFAPRAVDGWRESVIRPTLARVIGSFRTRGRAELMTDLIGQLPPRIIAQLMALPTDDDWIGEVMRLMKPISRVFDYQAIALSPEVLHAALDASKELNEFFRPFIEERRGSSGDDLISRLWREGPEILEGWSYEDVRANVRQLFFAASDTTSFATANALYMLLTDAGLAATLRNGDDRAIGNFVEESLRIHGSVQLRSRYTVKPNEVLGVPLEPPAVVTAVTAAANRDPSHYACPAEVQLDRKAPRDHLAFNFGPRTCVGAALARANIQETVRAVLDEPPGLRLDPDAPPPRYEGFIMRCYKPLNVLFETT